MEMQFTCHDTGLLTAINCYNVKWGANLQTVFTATKMLALVVIIIAGLVVMCVGEVQNLTEPWEGTRSDPGSIVRIMFIKYFRNLLNF